VTDPSFVADRSTVLQAVRERILSGDVERVVEAWQELGRSNRYPSSDGIPAEVFRLLIPVASPKQLLTLGPALLSQDRLLGLAKPEETVVPYLNKLYGAYLAKPDTRTEISLAEFLRILLSIWPRISENTRRSARLYEKLITALAAAGCKRELTELTQQLAPSLCAVDSELVAACLLRGLRQAGLAAQVLEIAEKLKERWPFPSALTIEWLRGLQFVAASAPDFACLVRIAAIAELVLDTMESAAASRHLEGCINELANILNLTGHFEGMKRLSRHLLDAADGERYRQKLIAMSEILVQYDDIETIAPIIERIYRAGPADPDAAALKAKHMLATEWTPDDVVGILSAVQPRGAQDDATMRWIAVQLYEHGALEESLQAFEKTSKRAPMDEERISNAKMKLAQGQSGDDPQPHRRERISIGELGPLAKPLFDLVILVNLDHEHASQPDPAEIRKRMRVSLAGLASFLESRTTAMTHCRDAARLLYQVAKSSFEFITLLQTTTPLTLHDAYGRLDPERFAAMHDGIAEHVALLAGHALRGKGAFRNVYEFCHLAELYTMALVDLDRASGARQLIGAYCQTCGQVCRTFFGRLMDLCLLQDGDMETAAALRSSIAIPAGEPHRSLELDAWADAERLDGDILLHDGSRSGSFEYVRRDGAVRRSDHALPATKLLSYRIQNLRIWGSEYTFGPSGALLKPHPWHCMKGYPAMNGIPPRNRFVQTRGKRAVRFKVAEGQRVIEEPVLALANLDVMSHYNYYHWMMLILTRINEAMERGLLSDRRLVLLEELEEWMESSLEVVGLGADRILMYRCEENLILRDVQLISPVDYTCHHLVRSLRARAWSAASVVGPREPGERLLFLSRRNFQKRTLIDEEGAAEIARRHGFEVVHPEELSILDQIRLFSQAAGIAGQVGAAFTNLMFAPDGTRVLAITKEEMSYPTFVDLCVVLNQHYRWLLGWTEGNFRNRGQVNTPYRIDFDLLDRELAWVSGGRA
jgi:hypothetical protein